MRERVQKIARGIVQKFTPESAKDAHEDFKIRMEDGFFQNKLPHFLELPYTARAEFKFDDVRALDSAKDDEGKWGFVMRIKLNPQSGAGEPRYIGVAFADSRNASEGKLTDWIMQNKFTDVVISRPVERFGDDTDETRRFAMTVPK